MTDYRIPSTMNLLTDYNAPLLEAFGSGTAPHSHHHHPPQPQQSSAAPNSSSAPPPPPLPFNQETLQHSLQALIMGARESWTYAIFWQSSYDYSGGYVLGWGDGYYEGEEDNGRGKSNVNSAAAEQEHRKKVLRDLYSLISGSAHSADDAVDEEVTDTEWFFLVSMTQSFVNGVGLPGQSFFNSRPVWVTGAESLASSSCDRARQGQTFGLQTIVYIPLWNGVVELGSTEVVFQSSDLMNAVRVLFNFINMEAGSSPLEQGENDPSSFWISEPSRAVELMKAGSWALDQGENGPSSLWIREPWSAVERKDSANPRSNTNQQTAFNKRLSNEKCSETGSSRNGAKVFDNAIGEGGFLIMAVNSTSVERHARGRKTFNVVGSCLKDATAKSTGEDNLRGPPSDRRLLPEPSYQNNQCPDQTPSIEPAKVFDDAIGRYSFSSMAVNETSHCAGETTINVPVTILKDATVKGTGGKSTRGVGIKRDWAWHYCSTIEGNSNGVICSFCDLEIKGGGITRFKTHIYDGDPCKNVKKCKKVPPEVKVEIEKRMKGGYNKRK